MANSVQCTSVGRYAPLQDQEKSPPPYEDHKDSNTAQQSHVTIALPARTIPGSTNGRNDRYNTEGGRVTGFVQMCIGTLVWLFSIVLAAETPVVQEWTYNFLVGALFIVAGILGLVTRNRINCAIVAYMSTCIVSAVGACFLILRSYATGVNAFIIYDGPWHCVMNHGESVCFDVSVKVIIAMATVSGICSFAGLVAAIVGSAFCCAGICRCCTGTTETAIVMYTPSVPDGHSNTASPPIYIAQSTANPPPSYEAQSVT